MKYIVKVLTFTAKPCQAKWDGTPFDRELAIKDYEEAARSVSESLRAAQEAAQSEHSLRASRTAELEQQLRAVAALRTVSDRLEVAAGPVRPAVAPASTPPPGQPAVAPSATSPTGRHSADPSPWQA